MTGRTMGMAAVVGFLLVVAACGDGGAVQRIEGAAALSPVEGSGVSGEASLQWDSDTELLTVTVQLDGLEEGATYATLIAPSCELHSGLVYQLATVVGEPDGTARATAEVTDVAGIDVGGGWAVKVARPPIGEQACGEVGPG